MLSWDSQLSTRFLRVSGAHRHPGGYGMVRSVCSTPQPTCSSQAYLPLMAPHFIISIHDTLYSKGPRILLQELRQRIDEAHPPYQDLQLVNFNKGAGLAFVIPKHFTPGDDTRAYSKWLLVHCNPRGGAPSHTQSPSMLVVHVPRVFCTKNFNSILKNWHQIFSAPNFATPNLAHTTPRPLGSNKRPKASCNH